MMKAKDMFYDFLNTVFIIILVGFCIVFFTVGDRFSNFLNIFEALVPISIFGIFLLANLKINRKAVAKREREHNLDINLSLTYFDKLKSDILIYSLPIIILSIALFLDKQITKTDIIQALAAFFLMYFWQRYIFRKAN